MAIECITPNPSCEICGGSGRTISAWMLRSYGRDSYTDDGYCNCVLEQWQDWNNQIEIVYPEGYMQ